MQDSIQSLPIGEVGGVNPPLDRTSPLPLYAQIKQRLIGLILRWDQPDRRFYSDEQLCAFFCVSRDTVRQALSELVHDGMLTRSRGLGTFVSVRKLEERFGPGMDFIEQWEAAGTPIQPTLLVFERCGAEEQVAAALEIDAGVEVLFIKRTPRRGSRAGRYRLPLSPRRSRRRLGRKLCARLALASAVAARRVAQRRVRHRGRRRRPGRSRIPASGCRRAGLDPHACAIARWAAAW